jgi:hypothetical protein
MKKDRRPENFDLETLKLFVVLGLLTMGLVFGVKWFVFPPPDRVVPVLEGRHP